MSDEKISALTDRVTLDGTENFAVEVGGVSNFRCTSAEIAAFVGGGGSGNYQFLSSTNLTGATTLVDLSGVTGREAILKIINGKFNTDNVNLFFKVQTGGGVQSASYRWAANRSDSGNNSGLGGNSNDSSILFSANIGNDTNEAISGELRIYDPVETANYKKMRFESAFDQFNDQFVQLQGGAAWRGGLAALTGIEFSISGGANFSAGEVLLYQVTD